MILKKYDIIHNKRDNVTTTTTTNVYLAMSLPSNQSTNGCGPLTQSAQFNLDNCPFENGALNDF